jgi:hypothetical protein
VFTSSDLGLVLVRVRRAAGRPGRVLSGRAAEPPECSRGLRVGQTFQYPDVT